MSVCIKIWRGKPAFQITSNSLHTNWICLHLRFQPDTFIVHCLKVLSWILGFICVFKPLNWWKHFIFCKICKICWQNLLPAHICLPVPKVISENSLVKVTQPSHLPIREQSQTLNEITQSYSSYRSYGSMRRPFDEARPWTIWHKRAFIFPI